MCDRQGKPYRRSGHKQIRRDLEERLGVTRSAVIKAAQAGRIKGKKIGHTWALLRRSVETYRVAQHRVEAGRAAHR